MKLEDIDWVSLKVELSRLLASYSLELCEVAGLWAFRDMYEDGVNVLLIPKRDD